MGYSFRVVDVFTSKRFGGNPLAVFQDAAGLDECTMQALAGELNLSETTFVLPPDNPSNTAKVRIFNRTAEMAFAGHPMIGTAFVLGSRHDVDRMTFEVPAGIVQVSLSRTDAGFVASCRIEAPQPLQVGREIPAKIVADALGVRDREIIQTRHKPLQASVGNEYVIVEVTADGLRTISPVLPAFERGLETLPHPAGRFSIYAYHRGPNHLRARMFAPLSGTIEDAATGSAACPLAALLLSRSDEQRAQFEVHQGVEMGRPSRLTAEAWREGREIRASVAGECVPMFSGRFDQE